MFFYSFLKIIYIISFILIGSILGSYANQLRYNKNKILVGFSFSFICIPFLSTFFHINYDDIIKIYNISTSVEQSLMLVSLSGISSYLGYSLVNNVTDKVLQKTVNKISNKQENQDKKLEELQQQLILSNAENEYHLSIQLIEISDKYLKEIEDEKLNEGCSKDKLKTKYLEGRKDAASKKLYDAFNAIKKSISYIEKLKTKDNNMEIFKDFQRYYIMKAYLLKRLDYVQEALNIVNGLLKHNPENKYILLYNKACYEIILYRKGNSHFSPDIIKKTITNLLSSTSENLENKRFIEKIKNQILLEKDPDLKDLFTKEELSSLKQKYST